MTTTILEHPTIRIPRNVYKGCQRCGGDLVLDRSAEAYLQGAVEYVCLQCGRQMSLRSVLERIEPQRPAA